MRLTIAMAAVSLWITALPAQAAVSGSDTEEQGAQSANGLQEVVITSHYEFLNADTSGTTNLPLPIEQVPQSISLVSYDFIEAADLKTLGAIAEYTPGAISIGNSENQGTVIQLRGFTAGQSIDGIPTVVAETYFEPDYSIYDRLEVVKGPSSVVYGVSSPGGLVNYVTKSATAQTPDYLVAQAGSWSSYRAEGQVAGALDAEGHVRAIGVFAQDQGDSFINELYHKQTTLYGGLNADLGNSITAYLHGGYERQQSPAFDGVVTEPDGSPPPVARSFFPGSRIIGMTGNIYHAEGDLTWHATDMWDFSLKGNYQTIGLRGTQSYSFGLESNGDLGIYGDSLDARITNYGVGLSSIYKLDNVGLKKSFLSLEALYQSSDDNDHYAYPANTGTVSIFDSQAAISQAFNSLIVPPFPVPFDREIKTETLTISGQSYWQVTEPLSVLLGVSYSKPKQSVAIDAPPQSFDVGGQTSYRAGVTYEFLPKTYGYVSYSQSFDPQPLYTINLTALPPITGEQYEAGIKYRDESARLLLTAALFDIKEKNVGEVSAVVDGLEYYAPIGELTHKGIELQALGELTPQWQINLGYAYLDPTITKATASLSATVGETQLFLPRQTFNLFTTYTLRDGVLKGLSFGGGARYVGPERTSYSTLSANEQGNPNQQVTPGFTQPLAGYTVVDTTAGYTFGKWLVQLNAHNIFDRHYFVNTYQTLYYGNVPGEPTSVALSVRLQF